MGKITFKLIKDIPVAKPALANLLVIDPLTLKLITTIPIGLTRGVIHLRVRAFV
jgi:hypothetical protein